MDDRTNLLDAIARIAGAIAEGGAPSSDRGAADDRAAAAVALARLRDKIATDAG